MSDQEAWHELCNMYLAEGEFGKAAFCMEEVLLHNPHSHLIHQRLAEIRYTMVSYISPLTSNEVHLMNLFSFRVASRIWNRLALTIRRPWSLIRITWGPFMAFTCAATIWTTLEPWAPNGRSCKSWVSGPSNNFWLNKRLYPWRLPLETWKSNRIDQHKHYKFVQ